jgi:organic radical activating enzyme
MGRGEEMRVNDVFLSIQGEGPNIGKPALFVRVAGCNLRCDFCDTKYAWNNGKEMTVSDIRQIFVDNLINTMFKRLGLVITGGEPGLYVDEVRLLVKLIGNLASFIDIETNGTLPIDVNGKNVNIIVSPKITCGMEMDILPDYFDRDNTYFKYVISNPYEVEKIIKRHKIRPERVYLMPLGTQVTPLWGVVARLCMKYGFNFSPRLQVIKEVNIK